MKIIEKQEKLPQPEGGIQAEIFAEIRIDGSKIKSVSIGDSFDNMEVIYRHDEQEKGRG